MSCPFLGNQELNCRLTPDLYKLNCSQFGAANQLYMYLEYTALNYTELYTISCYILFCNFQIFTKFTKNVLKSSSCFFFASATTRCACWPTNKVSLYLIRFVDFAYSHLFVVFLFLTFLYKVFVSGLFSS